MKLAKLKHDSLTDKKMRRQVRENSIKLRELKKKLKDSLNLFYDLVSLTIVL